MIFLPFVALMLSVLAASLTSYMSEPFLLYRLCMGSCHSMEYNKEWLAIYYSMIPAIILYLPAGISYAVIFTLVKRASNRQKDSDTCERNSRRVTADPVSIIESGNEENPSLSLHKRTLLNQFSKSFKGASSSFHESSEMNIQQVIHSRKRLSISMPARINLLTQTSSDERASGNKVRLKLIRKNIISAKLSIIVMVLLFIAGVVLSMTYNQVQEIQVILPLLESLVYW